MKFAVVNHQRQEPLPALSGSCPACGQPMVAKCGGIKVWHWAHRGKRHCDVWWENETEWHRAWKGKFPLHWQEIVRQADTGEKHIADVKTDRDWVIEFQHSFLKPDERRSRDHFYPRLIWVVDGTRRKRDCKQLYAAWRDGAPIGADPQLRRARAENCVLLREWGDSNAPVFFDLGEREVIWWRIAKCNGGAAYLVPYSRDQFIESHQGTTPEAARMFDEFVSDIPKLVADYEAQRRDQSLRRASVQTLPGFAQYLGRTARRRRRF